VRSGLAGASGPEHSRVGTAHLPEFHEVGSAHPAGLTIAAALPTVPLPLTVEVAIPIDLEQTYSRAAADAYLS
jgi:hypothetical protein